MNEPITQGASRFIMYDNPLIGFMALCIFVLCLFIFWIIRAYFNEKKETIEVQKELATSLAVLTEVVRNAKG